MAEFGLVLAVFSLAAITGWGVIASAANTRETTLQNNICSTALTPP